MFTKKRVLAKTDSGSVVDTQVGEHIIVVLDENPTTGYRWIVEGLEEPISICGDEYTSFDRSTVGSGGTRRFVFQANHPGKGEIRLALGRAWDTEPNTERFEITVRITEKEIHIGHK